MKQPKYSIGYNHDLKILDVILKYKQHIFEIYFPIPIEYLGSGRGIPQKNKYKLEILKIIDFCKNNDLKSNLLINPLCEGKLLDDKNHMELVVNYLKKMHSKGLDSVTLVNPNYMELIRKNIPDIEIIASVNCFIKTAETATFYKKFGANILILDRDINRDLALIEQIKKYSELKIRLMVNEACMYDCIFRQLHFNAAAHSLKSHNSSLKGNLSWLFCEKAIKMKKELIFKSPFIRPEDIKNYLQITDEFKLVTRSTSTEQVEKMLKAYVDQEYDGNLLDILSTEYAQDIFKFINNKKLDNYYFFKKMSSCKQKCNNCNYCNELVENCCVIK